MSEWKIMDKDRPVMEGQYWVSDVDGRVSCVKMDDGFFTDGVKEILFRDVVAYKYIEKPNPYSYDSPHDMGDSMDAIRPFVDMRKCLKLRAALEEALGVMGRAVSKKVRSNVENDTHLCSSCGNDVVYLARFCHHCGQALTWGRVHGRENSCNVEFNDEE